MGADQRGFRIRAVRSMIFISHRRVVSLVNITKKIKFPLKNKERKWGGGILPEKIKKKIKKIKQEKKIQEVL